jgi:dTDP-4-amino-4,6-dideoxygalactose transaminase
VKELYAQNGWTLPVLPKTEAMVNDILSLPMHPELTDEDARYVGEQVKAFFA